MELLGIIDIPDWVLIFALALIVFYVYATWNYGLWESQNIPTMKPFPFVGSVKAFGFFESVATVDLRNVRKYGKVFGLYEARRPALMISDLDMLKSVLIKDFNYFVDRRKVPLGGKSRITRPFLTNLTGDEWRSARAVLTPTFTSGKLRQMIGIMENCVHKMTASMHDDIKKHNGDINIKDRVSVFTMEVIASCCFGTSIDSQDPNDPFMQHARLLFNSDFTLIAFPMIFTPKLMELFEISMFSAKCLTYFEKVVHNVVNSRRSQNIRRNDFLQLLLDAQEREKEGKLLEDNENGHVNKTEATDDSSVGWKQHKVLDESGLVANSILFLLAGFDTTANTISFASYLLALNPECQQKLKDEIDQAIAKHGELTTDVILNLPYLEMVISETLRMYPPAVRLERLCVRDYQLGDIFIPKGCMVAAGVYAIHYDPEIYPEPHKFDPERFTYENKSQRQPMAYIPFGAGPRICIGMRFALMEVKICLAHIINQFRILKSAKTEVPLKMRNAIPMLIPLNGVTVKIEPRK
ncbi:hypothetical protein CHUAL_012471 [Chamberlinius hualienensis]